jgi:phosphoheptose isomerase
MNQTNVLGDDFFDELVSLSKDVKKKNGRFLFFVNGASAASSNHTVLDWSEKCGILALCLSDSALLTTLADDYDFEDCFLEFLKIN